MVRKNKNINIQNMDVNDYLTNVIHDQKTMMHEKEIEGYKPKFHSEINDSLTNLDITV